MLNILDWHFLNCHSDWNNLFTRTPSLISHFPTRQIPSSLLHWKKIVYCIKIKIFVFRKSSFYIIMNQRQLQYWFIEKYLMGTNWRVHRDNKFKTEVIFETTFFLQKRLHFSFEVTTNFVCTKHKMFYSAFTSHWWGARHKRLHSHALHHLRQNFVLTSGRHLISTGDASKTF